MGSENEPAKLLLPYLQRADELQKHELLVAYYCRLYAMERGLKIPQKDRTKTTNAILVSLMNQLEKDRKTLKLGPEDHLYIEGFASNVFAKADKQDRAGRADLNTAKTFYAASIFFEILNQFGEIQPDLEQKQKYAVWKAADIRKALKEGRKPVPGPPGGDKDLSEPSNSPNTAYDLGPSDNISASHQGTGAEVPSQFHEMGNYQSSGNTQTSPPSNPTGMSRSSSFNPTSEFSPDDFNTHPPPINRQESSSYPQPYQHQTYQPEPPQPPTNTQENSSYPQTYHHQTYQPEQPPQAPPNIHENSSYPQPPHHQTFQPEFQHIPPQNFPSHDLPPSSYSLPNFQSYPGFSDHSLPSAPTHTPYYQAPDPSYTQQSAPSVSNYQSSAPISSTSRNVTSAETGATSSQTFHYDVNYQPPPEKIAEAHKAARFAVGALAFDDVTVAVDFLRKSLELLTNPSASH